MPQFKHIDVETLRVKGEEVATKRFVEEQLARAIPVGGFKCQPPFTHIPNSSGHGHKQNNHGVPGVKLPPGMNDFEQCQPKHYKPPSPGGQFKEGCINYILSKIEPCPVEYPVWFEPVNDTTDPHKPSRPPHHPQHEHKPNHSHKPDGHEFHPPHIKEIRFQMDKIDNGVYKLDRLQVKQAADIDYELGIILNRVWLDVKTRIITISVDKPGSPRESFDIASLKQMIPMNALSQLSSIWEHAFGYNPIELCIKMEGCDVVIATIFVSEGKEYEHIYTFCDEIGLEYK